MCEHKAAPAYLVLTHSGRETNENEQPTPSPKKPNQKIPQYNDVVYIGKYASAYVYTHEHTYMYTYT